MEIGKWRFTLVRPPKRLPLVAQHGIAPGAEVEVKRAQVLDVLDDNSYDPGVVISINGQRVNTTLMNLRSKVAKR